MNEQVASSAISLEGNPGVNSEIIKELIALNEKLAAFGLQPSTGYSIAPALGGELVKSPPSAVPSSANAVFGQGFRSPER